MCLSSSYMWLGHISNHLNPDGSHSIIYMVPCVKLADDYGRCYLNRVCSGLASIV
jgi:hypothetical protein